MRGIRGVALILAGSLLLALSACDGASGPRSSGASTASESVDTSIPLPSGSPSVRVFRGQSLSDADAERFSRRLTAALHSGDERSFLAHFDQSRPRLLAGQRAWFRNVRSLPMSERTVRLVRTTDSIDSSGKATLQADFGFQYQLRDADPKPVAEWYSFRLVKRKGRLVVVGVGGAAADRGDGERYSRYYRQAWDDGPMSFAAGRRVLVLGPRSDERALRALVPAADAAVAQDYASFAQAGQPVPAELRRRRWVITVPAPGRSLFDYFGGEVRRNEANYIGVANPLFSSDLGTGDLELDKPAVTTRITLRRDQLGTDVTEVVRHEITHALTQRLTPRGYPQAPPWVVEGVAQVLEGYSPAAASSELALARAALASGRLHGRMPAASSFYTGGRRQTQENYAVGYAALRYLDETRGRTAMMRMVARFYRQSSPDVSAALGRPEAVFVRHLRRWLG